MSKVYEKIDELCKKRGISHGKLCTDLGYSRNTMAALKSGRSTTLKLDKANEISAYFNISIDELLGNEKKPTTQESSELAEIEKLIKDAKNRKANETMILKYSGGKPEAVVLSDEEMKIIDVLIENAKNRQK